jgi:hypothetical protein
MLKLKKAGSAAMSSFSKLHPIMKLRNAAAISLALLSSLATAAESTPQCAGDIRYKRLPDWPAFYSFFERCTPRGFIATVEVVVSTKGSVTSSRVIKLDGLSESEVSCVEARIDKILKKGVKVTPPSEPCHFTTTVRFIPE